MKKLNLVFVSFYTPNYAERVKPLIASLEKHGLTYDIEERPSLGTWMQNVHYKPVYILEKLRAHPEADGIVWLDADAVVNHYPDLLFELQCDLAVHFINGSQLFACTMFWAVNEMSERVLEAWIEDCPNWPKEWDQTVLNWMLGRNKFCGLKLKRLPTEYAKIFDAEEVEDKGREVIPVIEQFQHSRNVDKT